MVVEYLLGTIPIWPFFDNNGLPLSNGFLNMRRALNNADEKLVYRDPGGVIPYENPLQLSDVGKTEALIYFANDEPYEIWIEDADHQRINTVFNYVPDGGSGGAPVTVAIDQFNHFLNPQLSFPLSVGSPLPANTIVPLTEQGNSRWEFIKSNTSATDTLAMTPFPLGQIAVPGQPVYYASYQCTAVGAGGETFKDIQTRICNVVGFNGATIFVSGWYRSATSSTVEIIFRQFFGTGGLPSPTSEQSVTFNCTPSWSLFSAVFVINSIAGKTLGTNGDSALSFITRLPLNQISQVDLSNFQFVHGTTPPPFQHQSDEYIGALVKGNNLPFIPQPYSPSRGQAIILDETGNYNFGIPGAIAEIKTIAYDAVENSGIWKGWLKINSSIPRILNIVDYPDLAALLGTTWGGDGVTTFALPPLGNAAMIGANTAAPLRALGEVGGNDTRALDISNFPPLPNSGTYLVRDDTSTNDIALGASSLHLREQSGAGVPVVVKNPFCAVCMMIKF